MDSNEKNLDNSIESAVNMTQEEIERFLAQQEEQNNDKQSGFADADLASLLSELGEEEDRDIQEISNLLNRADNNEAVAADVVELMQRQEAEGETAYDAMDLFSGEQTEKKEGFFKRLLKKITGKKKKERKKDKQNEGVEEQEVIKQENASQDSLAEALALLGESSDVGEEPKTDTAEKRKDKKNTKKEKKAKKQKTGKKSQNSDISDENEEVIPEKTKKKDKKIKEKKVKEKRPKNEPIREKTPDENVVELLEEEEEVPHVKKIVMVFVAAVMIMLGFLVVNYYFTRHTSKKLAEEAYVAEDYLECYQLLYGQRLNDSQTAMFHRSELILKMDIFWNHYREYISNNQLLEGLDRLVQFVNDYPSLLDYSSEWNCQETVGDTYTDVLGILEQEYQVSEQEAQNIADLEDDIEYTRVLHELVEDKKINDAINQTYPDILPEEKDKITQN